MPFRFEPDEPLAAGLRRIINEERLLVRDRLRDSGADNLDDAIHEARKSFKRLRALVRLRRPALDPGLRRALDHSFRDLSRRLAAPRDAWVMLESWRRLDRRRRRPASPAFGRQHRQIEALLLRRYESARESVILDRREHLKVARGVGRFLAQLGDRPLDDVQPADLLRAVSLQYRRARRALRQVRDEPSPENRHEWRRQVKYLWHQLELIAPAAPDRLAPLAGGLKRLADLLGEEHDLAMLLEFIESQSDLPLDENMLVELRTRIQRRLHLLIPRANALGATVLDRRPRDFTASLSRGWTRFCRRLPASPLN
jgi:CHAD domain-containing protein